MIPGPTLISPYWVTVASSVIPPAALTVSTSVGLVTPNATWLPGLEVGAKFGRLASWIGPAQVLPPPVFRRAPVPAPPGPSGVPVPDRTRLSLATTVGVGVGRSGSLAIR